jgi:large subunit ribosomal protein L21
MLCFLDAKNIFINNKQEFAMYAVLKTGGKQYKVKADDLLDVEMLDGEVGTTVNFTEVLAVGEEGGKLQVGSPLLGGASVSAEITDQFRGKKLIAFKKKRRKGYRRKVGHRQELTKIKITAINIA